MAITPDEVRSGRYIDRFELLDRAEKLVNEYLLRYAHYLDLKSPIVLQSDRELTSLTSSLMWNHRLAEELAERFRRVGWDVMVEKGTAYSKIDLRFIPIEPNQDATTADVSVQTPPE